MCKKGVLWISILIFVILFNIGVAAELDDDEIREMLEGLLDGYDARIRPDYLGKPVKVTIDATILSFTNLDAIKMVYTVDMFFRQRWHDYRLKHSMNETLTIIVGTQHPADLIWTPDTVFINAVFSRLHHVTVNNHKVDISPNGDVFWGTRVTVSPKCYLNLMAYPMDVQTCDLLIMSYMYNNNHLKYAWQYDPGVHILDNQMAQFNLTGRRTRHENIQYVAGNYSVLTGSFQFTRLMGFAILQIYVPSTAIVCVSWVSLWIERNATPARVALCITTLLTISTIWSSVNSQLPRVNYVKAIDIYLMMSFCCVIFTLLEYTVVLNTGVFMDYVRKKRKKIVVRQEDDKRALMVETDMRTRRNATTTLVQRSTLNSTIKKQNKEDKDEQRKREKREAEENEQVANTIELFARVFFPVVYVLFNIFYWSSYLVEGEGEQWDVTLGDAANHTLSN